MLNELVESRRRPTPLGGQTLVSMLVHAGLALGLVGATRGVTLRPEPPRVVPNVIFTVPERTTPGPAGGGEEGVLPAVPDMTLPSIDVPTVVPTDLPAVDVAVPLDPKRLAGAIVRGNPTLVGVPGGVGTAPGAEFLLAAEADRVPELAEGARCDGAYPQVLRDVGLSGRAVLQFVVGADGVVDPASVRVVSASHPAFGTAAREGVLAASCRFRAGEYRGSAVAVLVQQGATFRIGPR